MELSFEYFPPRNDRQREQLRAARKRLAALDPNFCSVTFGAGGSTVDATVDTVMEMIDEAGPTAAPHLSCMGGTRARIGALLDTYEQAGVKRIVALRGDQPSGSVGVGDLQHATDLVAFARQRSGDAFHIAVACYPEVHPECASARRDLDFLAAKIDAGADSAITQYFYNPDAYFRFIEACSARGIDVPITPGIMPITNYTQLARFSQRCGAEIPRWLAGRLQDFGDDHAGLRAFGTEVVTELCRRLLEGGAPGLHVYTLNRAKATEAICANLGS